MIMGDDLPLCFFIAVEAATSLEATARQASPEGAFKPPKGFPMNEFSSPSTYADHLLKQHQGDRRAAIAAVVSQHEVDNQLRREAVEILKEGLPKWQVEFPHFPVEDMPDIPDTWEDISW